MLPVLHEIEDKKKEEEKELDHLYNHMEAL